MLGKKLLKRPLLDVLILVLLELGDELDGALEDRTLVLLAAWDDLGELIDALVDGLASSALNFSSCQYCMKGLFKSKLTLFVVIFADLVPLFRSHSWLVGTRPSTWGSRRVVQVTDRKSVV